MDGQLEGHYRKISDHRVVVLKSQDKLSEGFDFWKSFRVVFDVIDFAQCSSCRWQMLPLFLKEKEAVDKFCTKIDFKWFTYKIRQRTKSCDSYYYED